MKERVIEYLNKQTEIWMAQATPGELKELEGLWSDHARLIRHVALYMQNPHNVTLASNAAADAMLRYRWARDREFKARKMHERRRDRNITVNNTFTTVHNTSKVVNTTNTPVFVIQASPAARMEPAQAQPERTKRGRKPKDNSKLLEWIQTVEFKNPKKVGIRDLAKIIEKHLSMSEGNLRSTRYASIERALKGAKIGWRKSGIDWIAKVTSP